MPPQVKIAGTHATGDEKINVVNVPAAISYRGVHKPIGEASRKKESEFGPYMLGQPITEDDSDAIVWPLEQYPINQYITPLIPPCSDPLSKVLLPSLGPDSKIRIADAPSNQVSPSTSKESIRDEVAPKPFTSTIRAFCLEYWGKGFSSLVKQAVAKVPTLVNCESTYSAAKSAAASGYATILRVDLDRPAQTESVAYKYLELPPQYSELMPDGASKILIRREYERMYLLLWKVQGGRHNGLGWLSAPRAVVYLGQHGTGKRCFLLYAFILSILEGCPVLYQVERDSIIYVNGLGEVVALRPDELYMTTLERKGVWALVASGCATATPAFLERHMIDTWYTIMAASPESNPGWKRWTSRARTQVITLAPWSWEEIYILSSLRPEQSLDWHALSESFEQYGGTPPNCFRLANASAREAHDRDLVNTLKTGDKLHRIAETLSLSMIVLPSGNNAARNVLALVPKDTQGLKRGCRLASRHMAFLASAQLEIGDFWNMFLMFLQVDGVQDLQTAAWMWEAYVAAILGGCSTKWDDATRRQSVPLRRLGISDESDPQYIQIPLVDDLKADSRPDPMFFQPTVYTDETFDGVAVHRDGTVTIFRSEVSKDCYHRVDAAYLDALERGLRIAIPGSSFDKWRLVFVVPHGMAREWEIFDQFQGGKAEKWGQIMELNVMELPRPKWCNDKYDP